MAYVTTAYGYVYALDAATGKLIWKWTPPKQQAEGLIASAHGFPNRGVAYGNGTVYVLTPNARLFAIDAKTGKAQWNVPVVQNAVKDGYTESTAPIYYNGTVYIGSSGSDVGTRGFEEALSGKDGHLIWRFWTVPARGQGWMKTTGNHGGGDVWMVPTLDTNTGILYVSVGNPSPDFYSANRPGINPYTDSVVALNAKSGKLIWSYSEAPHDEWDYDAVSPVTLFPAQGMLAAGEAGKDGYWYEWNATTGQAITMPEPFVKEDHHTPPLSGKVLNWPGAVGGSEWSPVPYDPQTHYTYVEGDNIPMLEQASRTQSAQHQAGQADYGTTFSNPANIKPSGTLTAFNTADGTAVWQKKEPAGEVGGATATAGGLLFAGQSGTGQFQAFNAKTGKLLWQNNAGGRIDDAASVYSVNGTEYVLIPVGGSSLAGSQLGGLNTSNATFVAYKLGSSVTWTPQKGAAALAPTPAPSKAPAPAPSKAPTTPAGTVRVNKYMSYSAKQKTVDLHILGGEGSENNGFNFDGLSGGKLNITIPQGWKVKVTFTNQGSLNHSVFVMAQNGSPNPPITPAFKGATTPNPLVGMKTGASATFTFTAAKPGKYKWVCAVPGHYQLGMWDWLTVSTSGTPTYNANFSG